MSWLFAVKRSACTPAPATDTPFKAIPSVAAVSPATEAANAAPSLTPSTSNKPAPTAVKIAAPSAATLRLVPMTAVVITY